MIQTERTILRCFGEIKQAHEVIRREKEIGDVTGYINTARMHQAGEIIVTCQERIPKLYKEYQSLGGTKTLQELNK